jgi:hypothetical protein
MSKRRLVPSELAVIWDVIVDPRSAFAAIGARPRWLIAYLVTCALTLTGEVVKLPAIVRMAEPVSTDNQHALMARFVAAHHSYAATPLLIILGNALLALILWLVLAAVKGHTRFSEMFALATHVAIVSGLSVLYLGIVLALTSAGGFPMPRHPTDIVPSLALFVPHAAPRLGAFLATLNVFNLWSTALLALGFQIIGQVSGRTAISTAIALLFLNAGAGAYLAR